MNKLFDSFPEASSEDWREAAEKLLKGKPFDKIMRKKMYEGILLEPIYNEQDITHPSLPGVFPYTRATNSDPQIRWLNPQKIFAQDPTEYNSRLRHQLERGQNAISLDLPGDPKLIAPYISKALEEISLEKHPIFLDAGRASIFLVASLAQYLQSQNIPSQEVECYVALDPISLALRTGKMPSEYQKLIASYLAWLKRQMPKARGLAVDAVVFHESGASADQELAFAIATGIDYLKTWTDDNHSVDDLAMQLHFRFALGSNFFLEISKLRAVRSLWAKVVRQFGGNERSQKISLHTQTGNLDKTYLDAQTNILRTTTQGLSAVLGGCDSLTIAPFDYLKRTSEDNLAERVALNMHTILREECHLDKVIDPAGGSWYIESLTENLAQTAWQHVQEIEKQGGIAAAVRSGFIHEMIEKVAVKRKHHFATRKDVLVGVNMFANPKEQVVTEEHGSGCPRDFFSGGTNSMEELLSKITQVVDESSEEWDEVQKLPMFRIAFPLEKLRGQICKAKEANQLPVITLLGMGQVADYRARSDFAYDFFTAGSWEIATQNFTDAATARSYLQSTPPAVMVICSTDNKYEEIVPSLVPQFKEKNPNAIIILAGYPKDKIDSYREYGIDEFIHVKSDFIELMANLVQKLGGES